MMGFVVARGDSGKSLQDFLAAQLGLSRRAAKAIVDGRNVWVNNRCVWIAHHQLKIGDSVQLPKMVASAARAQAGSAKHEVAPAQRRHVRILVETPEYVICDKPAGLLSNEDDHSVERILREQLSIPTLQAVHRLDRDTSGCLLYAKNYAAYLAAVEVFKTRTVTKIYKTIVAGRFPFAHQLITSPLDNERAVSKVVREQVGDEASFLTVKIETGRTNQIRRHLSAVRSPIVGDRMFGLKSARDPRLMTVPRLMLHAATLELPNPLYKGEKLTAHSPLPADFRAALKLFAMGKKK